MVWFGTRLSLEQKLTLIIMLVSLSSVLLSTLAVSLYGIHHLRNSILEEFSTTASLLAERSNEAVAVVDEALVQEHLHALGMLHRVQEACIYDANFVALASYSRDKDFIICPVVLSASNRFINGHLYLYQDILNGNRERIGVIYLNSDLKEINSYLHKQIWTAMAISIIILGLSYLLAHYLQRSVTRPILRLADTAKAIAEHGDYTLRANLSRQEGHENDEIGVLIRAFNRMLSRIERQRKTLLIRNAELSAAKERAEGYSNAKSEFLSNMSHELRTPLNAIINFSAIQKDEILGPLRNKKYKEYSSDIYHSGQHLLALINDILDFSQSEEGSLTLHVKPVKIQSLLRECLSLFEHQAKECNITLSSDIPKKLPTLPTDPVRLKQILLNLLSNALKFTPGGGEVTLRVKQRGQGKPRLEISVEDNGIGMTSEEITTALTRFGRAKRQVKGRKSEGLGLGLPFTQKLVSLLGGRLSIESTPGQGTIVRAVFKIDA